MNCFALLLLLNIFLLISSLKSPRFLSTKDNSKISNKSLRVQSNTINNKSKLVPYELYSLKANSVIDSAFVSAGPVFFILLQISTLNTALFIYKSKSVLNLSPVPFISLFVNCLVWTLYGYLKKDLTVLIPNFSGLLVGIISMFIYHIYSKEKPYLPYKISFIISLITIILFLYNKTSSIGLLGCLLSVILSASPLAVFKTVIKEKSTSSLPFGTSIILWINNISWLIYGFVYAKDPMIYGPSILGTILASFQLALFLKYGFPEKDKG